MINFKDEIKKYEPILEVGDIEDSIRSTELKDIMDMLYYISKSKEEDRRTPRQPSGSKWS